MRHALLSALLLLAAPALANVPALTLERLFANPPLLGTPPRALTVAPDGRHVAWLAPRADDQLRFDLWVRDLETGAERMAVDSLALSSGPVTLSEAELMRRERARLASARGIVDYQWAPDGRAMLVPLDGDIWLAPLDGLPRRLTMTPETETDAKLSPRGRFASFVRDQNLHLIELATGRERAVTTGGGGLVSYGVAEFVAQEEMDRTTGQWWSPDDRRIAVARIDESPVKVAVRAAIGSDGTRVTEQRYPFAGTPNVLVSLAIHDAEGGAPVPVELGAETDIYLARVDWLGPDRLVVQRQSRDQKRLDLLLVDAATGASRLLFSETSRTWVSLHSSFRPLADGRRFLWASERSGFRHLYLWDGRALRPVTRGRWDLDELLGVDEAGGQLLFTGWRDSPLEKALYRVQLSGGAPVRLTPPGGWAEASADRRGTKALVSWSAPDQPTEAWLVHADGRRETIRANPLERTPYAPLAAAHVPARHGTVMAADGRTPLNYALLLPAGLAPGERVPVFFEVYAGPGVQRVRRHFGSALHQYLVRKGWAVFLVDNRGTPARGRAFADALYRKLGVTEVADQMAALDWVKRQPWADPDRVAAYGWSYGGYMVKRLMTEHPLAFSAGVAGAPVTDWTLYDTHYTERYLGNPAIDRAPYDESDVTRRAGRLARPLLIIHGLADDNVVFDHSAKMMGALQQAGRPFETMVYPGQTHRIAEPALQRHMWETILAFLDRTVRTSSGSQGRSPDPR